MKKILIYKDRNSQYYLCLANGAPQFSEPTPLPKLVVERCTHSSVYDRGCVEGDHDYLRTRGMTQRQRDIVYDKHMNF